MSKVRPSWCRAATAKECDHPHGCSGCCPVLKNHRTSDRSIGHVKRAEVIGDRLFIDAMLSPEGLQYVKKLEAALTLVFPLELLQAVGAVARPASKKAGLSIRVAKRRRVKGSCPSGHTAKRSASSRPRPAHQRRSRQKGRRSSKR
jgi:hypothetical protein